MAELATPLTPWLHSPRSSTDVSVFKAGAKPAADFLESAQVPFKLLPSPSFLFQHPLHVLTTRQLLSPYIAKASCRDNLYLRTSQDPSVRRLFVDAVSSGLVDGDGRDIKTVKSLPLEEADLWTTAKEIRTRYGWRGFFRGALGAHCIDLLNASVASQLDNVARNATVALVGEDDEEQKPLSMYRTRPVSERVGIWLRRSEGRTLLAKIIAVNIAHALTYPLTTVNLRQIAYESYDGVRVGFIDMARLTILYDGSRAFYGGFTSYLVAKFITSMVQLTTSCASAICDFPSISDRAGTIAEVLVTPLMQHSRHLRALSNMPGLPQECPPLKSRLPAIFSPICLIDLMVNTGFILHRVQK